MPDEPIPDPSPVEPSGADGDLAAEDDLDALLDAAAALASDVTEELGVSEEDHTAAQAEPATRSTDEPAPDLEAKLDRIDSLLEETNQEVGAATPAARDDAPAKAEGAEQADSDSESVAQPTAPGPPPPAAEDPPVDIDAQLAALDGLLDDTGGEVKAETPTDETSGPQSGDDAETLPAPGDAVPDFMREFTELEGESNATPEPAERPAATQESAAVPDFMAEFTTPEAASGGASPAVEGGNQQPAPDDQTLDEPTSPADPRPGVVSSRDRRVISSQGIAQGSDPAGHEANLSEAHEEEFLAAATATTPKSLAVQQLLARMAAPLSPLALKVSEVGVRALEALDRPVQRLGYWPRLFMGWLGIATIGASLLVFVASMF